MDTKAARLLTLVFAFGAIACGDAPVGLEEAEGSLCQPPAELRSIVGPPTTSPTAMRPALTHASMVMTAGLDPSPQLTELQRILTQLGQTFGMARDADCRQLSEAWILIHDLPARPETQPDREAILFVLELAASSLAS